MIGIGGCIVEGCSRRWAGRESMCGGIDDAVGYAERHSWKYVECSRTWAASFAAAGRYDGREEWSGWNPDSERVEGRKHLFGCAIEHDAAIIAALLRDVV